MRIEDLKPGDTLRTVSGELRLLVRVEKHDETDFDVWLTWLTLEHGVVKRYSYSLIEPISPSCEVIRRGQALDLS
jgi:hypothetical protein